jgi:hypothetical protein
VRDDSREAIEFSIERSSCLENWAMKTIVPEKGTDQQQGICSSRIPSGYEEGCSAQELPSESDD